MPCTAPHVLGTSPTCWGPSAGASRGQGLLRPRALCCEVLSGSHGGSAQSAQCMDVGFCDFLLWVVVVPRHLSPQCWGNWVSPVCRWGRWPQKHIADTPAQQEQPWRSPSEEWPACMLFPHLGATSPPQGLEVMGGTLSGD